MRDLFIDRLFPLLLVVGLLTLPVSAQKKVEQATLDPHIAHLFPAGGQVGTTVNVMVAGQSFNDIKSIRVTGEDITAELLERVSDESLRVTVKLGPKAKPGMHDFRVIARNGISNRFRFFVDQYPEVLEDKADDKSKAPMEIDLADAQKIGALPVVVNGRVFGADRDLYAFEARAGQTLVFDVKARAILPYVADAVPGWFQSCISLLDAKGRVVVFADDNRFDPDPRLIHTFASDGTYYIEIHDALFRGREDWVYRIRMGELPTVTHVYPLGATRNEQQTFELFGVHLQQKTVTMNFSDSSKSISQIQVTNDKGFVSNAVPVLVNDLPSIEEVEPNNYNKQAQLIQWPACVNGRIDKPGDFDTFSIQTTKNNQELLINVYARRLDSPMDSFVDLMDGKGKWIKGYDDQVDEAFPLITHHADSRVLYTFRRKGRYMFRIRETQGKGGSEYAYRLVVCEPQPDFALRLMPINRSIAPGGTAELTAQVIRQPGFTAPVALTFDNLPEGMTIRGANIPKGQDVVRLTITAPDQLEGTLLTPSLTGCATIDKQTITRIADPAQEVMQAFIYKHRPTTEELLLAVAEPKYFTVSLADPQLPVLEIPVGGEVEVTFNLKREDKNKRAVRLVGYNPAKGISVRPTTIKPGETSGTIKISAIKWAKPGLETNIIIHGEMKQGKKQRIDIPAPAVTVRVVAASDTDK
ncbi:MAG TPA: hypothetical protein DCM28_19645 [Phycisphaerales bacterium]|nr:hypothetical protein [Phycisphaerales bacterium]|tara:strand:- start:23394 stop:25484 length:2091 start_codon:yes stop_codon:yes gene_type:complete